MMIDPAATVDDYMLVDVLTFRPTTEIHTAMRILVERNISGAPVTDSGGQLVGMLTQKDCLRVVFGASYHQDWGGRVEDYMSADVEVILSGTSIIAAAERFLNSIYRRYPIVLDDRMIGLLCRREVLRAIQAMWPQG